MVALGMESFTYQVVEHWAQLPDGWSFKEVGGVGVDAQDNVYVFNRGAHPVMVFDRSGKFLRSWGEGIFPRAHGITMGPDDTMFLSDDGDHTVRKCTLDGKILFTLGASGKPAPFMSGDPFNRCTHVAIDPRNGDFYVVHNIGTDKDGWVYVADRENHRVQVFDPNGKFETQWVNMARPCGLYIDQASELAYIGELGAAIGANAEGRKLGPRVSIYNTQGQLLARLGDEGEGEAPGRFIAPHGVCIDSRGDIYVGEVSWTHTGSRLNPPRELRSLQKLARQG